MLRRLRWGTNKSEVIWDYISMSLNLHLFKHELHIATEKWVSGWKWENINRSMYWGLRLSSRHKPERKNRNKKIGTIEFTCFFGDGCGCSVFNTFGWWQMWGQLLIIGRHRRRICRWFLFVCIHIRHMCVVVVRVSTNQMLQTIDAYRTSTRTSSKSNFSNEYCLWALWTQFGCDFNGDTSIKTTDDKKRALYLCADSFLLLTYPLRKTHNTLTEIKAHIHTCIRLTDAL